MFSTHSQAAGRLTMGRPVRSLATFGIAIATVTICFDAVASGIVTEKAQVDIPWTGTANPYTGTWPAWTGSAHPYVGTWPAWTGTGNPYTGTWPKWTGTADPYTGTRPAVTIMKKTTATTPTTTTKRRNGGPMNQLDECYNFECEGDPEECYRTVSPFAFCPRRSQYCKLTRKVDTRGNVTVKAECVSQMCEFSSMSSVARGGDIISCCCGSHLCNDHTLLALSSSPRSCALESLAVFVVVVASAYPSFKILFGHTG